MSWATAKSSRLLVAIWPILAFAAVVLLTIATLRGGEYDEAYTVFLTNGTAKPAWPPHPIQAGEAVATTQSGASLASIARDLRQGDVHPPLYFWAAWAWRGVAGDSLLAARFFSVLCALAALALVAAIARALTIPAIPATLLCLGSYAFAYTGAIARGFALAQLLNLLGVWLLLRGRAIAAGLALGAAAATNYLAVFVAGAALAWLILHRHWRRAAVLVLGMVPGLALALYFFLAQRASRTGQFPPFDLLPALARLGQYGVASLLGGLPLYAGPARGFLSVALGAFALGLSILVLAQARRVPLVALLTTAAPPIGLLALGLIFNNTPIELRYLAFASPFLALLLAAALPRPLLALVLAIQTLSLTGLATRPETMQPQAATAREAARLAGPTGIVLVPHGNDGVGVAGAFLLAAPAHLRVQIITTPPSAIAEDRVVLALLALDQESRATTARLLTHMDKYPSWRLAAEAANLRAYQRQRGE